MSTIDPVSIPDPAPDHVPIAVLIHNERNIAADFLAHYRAICRPLFLVLDDHSTDGSFEFMQAQRDVCLYRPAHGSIYKRDKSDWRSEMLDRHGAGRWCLAPDMDEHFVFPRMEARPLSAYLDDLDAEGAEAVLTLMIDMYADLPLRDHVYPVAGRAEGLRAAFPFFDGPGAFPQGYHMRLASWRARRRLPTPPVVLSGGVRERLFNDAAQRTGALQRAIIAQFNGLDGLVAPGPAARLGHRLFRKLTRPAFENAMNQTKLGLIRWQPGTRFSGGPHRVDRALRMSEGIAAYLHYKFTRGAAGLEYIARRGQHADGARHYKAMLAGAAALDASPVAAISRRYEGSASLAGLIREAPAKARNTGSQR